MIETSKRKRGRPTPSASTPPPTSRKTSSRIASNTNRKPTESEARSSSRKRGRPSAHLIPGQENIDAKRRRDSSPIASTKSEEEDDSDFDEAGELKIDKNGKLLGGKTSDWFI